MAEQEQNLGKSVEMPGREELLKRLPDGTLGLTPETDAFYTRFIDSIFGTSKVGAGLYIAWELAGYDTLRVYPAIMRAVVNMTFDRVVDAISPDHQVAEAAKKFRRKVMEEAEEQRKAAEPTAETLGQADSLIDFERYSQARRVADIVFEYASGNVNGPLDQIWMEDRRNGEANPFYKQTHRGFFLEGYYGSIPTLWTPWGQYGFGGSGSGSWREATPQILERLGATEYKPETDTEMGTIGPIWTVYRIDDIVLPSPIERPRSQFVPYEEVKQAWKSLTQQYKAQQRRPRK